LHSYTARENNIEFLPMISNVKDEFASLEVFYVGGTTERSLLMRVQRLEELNVPNKGKDIIYVSFGSVPTVHITCIPNCLD
jgi:hypothetical protein